MHNIRNFHEGNITVGEWLGSGRVLAGERQGMCESVFKRLHNKRIYAPVAAEGWSNSEIRRNIEATSPGNQTETGTASRESQQRLKTKLADSTLFVSK
jgi:hypothetical protein